MCRFKRLSREKLIWRRGALAWKHEGAMSRIESTASSCVEMGCAQECWRCIWTGAQLQTQGKKLELRAVWSLGTEQDIWEKVKTVSLKMCTYIWLSLYIISRSAGIPANNIGLGKNSACYNNIVYNGVKKSGRRALLQFLRFPRYDILGAHPNVTHLLISLSWRKYEHQKLFWPSQEVFLFYDCIIMPANVVT